MNGSSAILVVALIAMSGLLASGQLVAEGPTTYQTQKHFPTEFSVYENVETRNDGEILPARDFTLGALTRNSIAVASLVINSDSPGYTVFGNTTSFDMHLTFIEIFDTSVDGLSGGNVQWLSGDVGSFEFQLAVTPLSASQPLRMYIVVYAVNEHWAGRNYRFGYYRADLQLLSLTRVTGPGSANALSSLTYSTIVNGEIIYIQSEDLVIQGQGALYLNAGGIGASNVTLWSLSGYGEINDRTVEVYGYRT